MPTLAEKGKFGFHGKAKLTEEMKKWLENDRAIDIIIKVLKMKLAGTGKTNRLYFLRGRTGSGKSTFMIQEIYKNIIVGEGTTLWCTQPRVVLTKSNPTELVRYNKDWSFGTNIGVRNGSEKINTTCRDGIVYCTTAIMGNLLVELMSTSEKDKQIKLMKRLKVVVIDECHVLDSPMMALLKTVYDVVEKFGNEVDCPLFIFSSATIDLDHMVEYYFQDVKKEDIQLNPLVIGDVQGVPNFPVEENFLSSEELKEFNKKEQNGAVGFELFAQYFVDKWLSKLFESKSTINVNNEEIACRDALLFVPLFSAISLIGDYLESKVKNVEFFKVGKDCAFKEVEAWRNKNRGKKRVLYVGYGRNYSQASDYLLETALERDEEARKNEAKIICSTSVIETGKTISTLYLCMNMGIETMSLYNPLTYKAANSIQYLKQVPINKNQAIQRKGRVGRECPGVFVHFYSKKAFEQFRNNDIAETINNSYLSGLVLNDLCQFDVGVYRDVFNLNNYYYPTSTDILINSARDLVNAGYLTLMGQFVALNNSIKHCENWVIYAKFLFYCLGWSLWDALLLASLNRKSLPPMMNLFSVEPKTLRIQLNMVNEETANDDIIESIMRAKNMMISILYGSDETFKCSTDRAYKSINVNEHDDNSVLIKSANVNDDTNDDVPIKGAKINDYISDWNSLAHLGRL